jgi:predicted phage tail protein
MYQQSNPAQLIKVKLLGELGRKFGRVWEFYIHTPADAIRALTANLGDSFTEYLYSSEERGVGYRVVTESCEGIGIDELGLGCTRVIIAPQIQGSGGFGRILLGGALLVGSFFMPATLSLFGMGISSMAVGMLGASLILGGITQMLTPTPKTPKRGDAERKDSFLFHGGAELGYQGLPVPVGYGQMLVTELPVISVGISVEDVPL